MHRIIPVFVLFSVFLLAMSCHVPSSVQPFVVSSDMSQLKRYPDVRRNLHSLKQLCVHKIAFDEGKQHWEMLLINHPKSPKGLFWFLPHDNENTAFDSAVYAVSRYGGGFLSVLSQGHRYHAGQDPNRNFSKNKHKEPSCQYQKAPSFGYTHHVFQIIDSYKKRSYPYLALHNNTNGGGVSVLKSSKTVHSYPAYPIQMIKNGHGLKDEDSLVYIAGKSPFPPESKLKKLLSNGLNVKYETVYQSHNDCSMSNYVVLGKQSSHYFNIEAQHGDAITQRKMIDLLVRRIMR
jgi:hypothetical protein